MEFRHQFFGYSRSAVDQYAAEHEAMLRSLKSEIETLRAAEPLLSASEEISGLLTSFAVAVSTTREQAERDAMTTRRAAEEYAEGLKQDAVRLFNEERMRASVVADDIIRRAREEVAILTRAQDRVELALNEAAKGIFSLIDLFDHLRTDGGLAEPAAGRGQDEAGVDRRAPNGEVGQEQMAPEPVVLPDHHEPSSPPADHPFGAVPIDPRNGMIVSFSPPPELPDTGN